LRSVVLGTVAFFASPGLASAADVVTLRAGPSPVRFAGRVAFSGAVTPVVAGEAIGIYAQGRSGWLLVGSASTNAAGSFSLAATVKTHRVFVARAIDAQGKPVESAPVSVLIRPRVVASLRGSRRIGARLHLVGRVQPRVAGTVTLTEGDRVRRVAVGPNGRFVAQLTTTQIFRYRATVRLRPATGYVAWHRRYAVRIKLRPLAIGSRNAAVKWLEYKLSRLDHYALPGVDNLYDQGTADAVLAFQKVHGLPRTGSVDSRFWGVLRASGPPLARVRSGDHIEIDKTRQVLFEIRNGEVISVSHVSTGATGNTPVGHWHVYSKGPGFNAKGMFDSLFFIGEFAIHGYISVPSYPASHGCVRTPFWFASGFYARWGIGTSVYVFP
jgi:putative peptidoglycan binding protein/L,D-transpeptidase-like protein